MFKKYFDFSTPDNLLKKLFEIKDARKNSELVEEIKNRWSNLKDKTEKMSEEEIKNKKLNETLGIINKILGLNKDIQKQQGQGLKI